MSLPASPHPFSTYKPFWDRPARSFAPDCPRCRAFRANGGGSLLQQLRFHRPQDDQAPYPCWFQERNFRYWSASMRWDKPPGWQKVRPFPFAELGIEPWRFPVPFHEVYRSRRILHPWRWWVPRGTPRPVLVRRGYRKPWHRPTKAQAAREAAGTVRIFPDAPPLTPPPGAIVLPEGIGDWREHPYEPLTLSGFLVAHSQARSPGAIPAQEAPESTGRAGSLMQRPRRSKPGWQEDGWD